jgi:hypothetical protein
MGGVDVIMIIDFYQGVLVSKSWIFKSKIMVLIFKNKLLA